MSYEDIDVALDIVLRTLDEDLGIAGMPHETAVAILVATRIVTNLALPASGVYRTLN